MTNQASKQLRSEHPRPQFIRKDWVNLNGEWEFEYDDSQVGDQEQWHSSERVFSRRIQVPFAFQSKLSGIGDPEFHDTVWYRNNFSVPISFKGKRVLLHFGAVDYCASVWVNGNLVAQHEGGHTPFHADITNALRNDGNTIVVKAVDYSRDVSLPRGKQHWLSDSASIFYTRTTGIWQTVWMEAVAPAYLDKVKFTSDIDQNAIEMSMIFQGLKGEENLRVKIDISFKGEHISQDVIQVNTPNEVRTIHLADFNDHGLGRWWSPEHPNLYDVVFTVLEGDTVVDEVSSYFGMRKVSIENGKFNLNNRPYFQKLVLDQGYFPDGNLTPPSDDAIKQDVELMKAMGFNGARKHQKLEDPRYLYWCDRLGLLVWSEAANAFEFSEVYVRRFMNEWQESVARDYNHPSIVAWVPLNESWGVPNIQIDKLQQQHALTMYHLTKSLDPMRPVVSNDGWEMVKTDLFNIHDYEWRQEVLTERYSSTDKAVNAMPANRRLSVEGFPYEGQPILVTELGGIAYKKSEWEGWGYSGAENDEDFASKLRAVIQPLLQSSIVQGYCYTQLTDVEQEINGLLTYDRVPKLPVDVIRAINEGN
ncbi:glycoside hydrolase family 2 [Paenibacillus anaericanus]|uniref:Glycoside hydrolase family 2 n=1 Tax=Paenibacillus anaericanus TaxID=170367 RepID=A0A433Y533_9BACL|nr:sugar-binding domain-containing protein [Paenibacillus anaericanus]RUT43422.1 glycoside hydrolase family 2 [Paenibacillus anaericanus]